MTRTAFVFDRSRETALARAQLVTRALHAAAPGEWTVEAVSSRNRLLADIARAPLHPRSLALVDLADNERNIVWRLGDRIIATIAAHPDLRSRCTPVALTAYGENAVAAAVRGVGGAGLIDATELLVSIDDHAPNIGALLVELADNDRGAGRAFRRWPPSDALAATPDTDAQIATEFERWFGKRFAPWHLEVLAGLAVGKGPAKIAQELVELEHHENADTAAKRVSEFNAALARHGPGPTIAESAARFLTHIAYLSLPGPSTTRYPHLETAEDWYTAAGRVRTSAWLLPEDERIFDAVRHHHRALTPARRSGNRKSDAQDRQIVDACRAAADALAAPLLRVLAATERTLQALHDAHADYCEWPQVELGHAIRDLEAEPVLVRWRARLAPKLSGHTIALRDMPPVALRTNGRIDVAGGDAGAWERTTSGLTPDLLIAVTDLQAGLAHVLADTERVTLTQTIPRDGIHSGP